MQSAGRQSWGDRVAAGVVGVGILVILAALLSFYALTRALNHDEYQFLAPGLLIGQEHLLPYRDFPLFHLPNLAFLYAGLAASCIDYIQAAKLLNVFSSVGVLGCLYWALGLGQVGMVSLWRRAGIFLALSCCLILDPLFVYTTGKTWNHELPAFSIMVALMFHVETFRAPRWWTFSACGFFAGFAVGSRLTYLIPAVAFGLHYMLSPASFRPKLNACLWWGGGFILAMLPTMACAVAQPEAFIFDNLSFPRLRLLDPDNSRIQKTISWFRKIRFLFKEVLPRSWVLCVGFIALGACHIRRSGWHWQRLGQGTQAIMLLLPLTVVGCFAPSRYQYQHLYAIPILLAAGIVFLLVENPGLLRHWGFWMCTAVLMLSALLALGPVAVGEKDRSNSGWRVWKHALLAINPADRFTHKLQRQQASLRNLLPPHTRVLTLTPSLVQAVGMRIYPEFATGVFGWRSAKFVKPEKRLRLKLIAPKDLENRFEPDLPAGILTGAEDPEEEAPLIQFAYDKGYSPQKVNKGVLLWLPPSGTR